MGWAILLLLVLLSLVALWLLGVRGGLAKACAAALLFGASGYAFQGRPALRGSTAESSESQKPILLTQARHAFFGDFSPEESWMRMSEALARTGNTKDAVNILTNAVTRYPGDAHLWVGLGNALVDHGHGLTPPAEMAYARAAELLPGHPAPRFFHDLALARSGQGEPALEDLIALIREHPDASWRPMAEQLAVAIASSRQDRPARP